MQRVPSNVRARTRAEHIDASGSLIDMVWSCLATCVHARIKCKNESPIGWESRFVYRRLRIHTVPVILLCKSCHQYAHSTRMRCGNTCPQRKLLTPANVIPKRVCTCTRTGRIEVLHIPLCMYVCISVIVYMFIYASLCMHGHSTLFLTCVSC